MQMPREMIEIFVGLIGGLITFFFMRGLQNKKQKELEKDIYKLELDIKNKEKNDKESKGWLNFIQDQMQQQLTPIRELIESKIDFVGIRVDKLESMMRKISTKIPHFKEPNGHRKALILEDEVMMSEMLTMYLEEKLDVYVVRVSNAKEGVEKIKQYKDKPFDFVLADVNLKGDKADDFINYCIENNLMQDNINGLRIVLYSGESDVGKNKWRLPYLEKPFQLKQLKNKVMNYI